MNKISKKIVSLVTMAAFALTLVPAAAFAAEGTDSTVVVRSEDATIVEGGEASINVTVGSLDENENIVLWVQKGNAIYDKATYEVSGANEVTTSAHEWDNTVIIEGTSAGTVATVDVTIPDDGLYTVCAGVSTDNKAANLEALDPINITKDNTITVINAAVSEQSKYGVIKNDQVQAEASVAVDTDLETTFYINDDDAIATGDVLNNVWVWAENEKGEVTGLSKVTKGNGANLSVGTAVNLPGTDRYAFPLTGVANGDKLNVQFDAAGTYTLYAGVGTDFDTAKEATLNKDKVYTVVTVTDDSEITSLDLTADKGKLTKDPDADVYTLDLTDADFHFDGNDKIVINGTAYVNDSDKVAVNKTINFDVTAPQSVVEFWNTDNSTGNDGVFGTTITMQDKQNALITITDSEGNVEYTLRIVALKTTATNIDRTLTGGYVLAGTDKDYAKSVYEGKKVKFDNAVEFEITDQKGNPVTDVANDDVVIDVKGKPGKSSLDNKDLSLVSLGNGKYTLAYENVVGDGYAKDLIEGEYTVRVSLPDSPRQDNATVTFTAAEFGKIKDVQIELTANGNTKLDDEVMLGDVVEVGLVYVDGNGLKVPYNGSFNWNVKNDAHAVIAAPNYVDKTFVLKADTIEHQGVIGSEVTVNAAVDGFGLVTKTLTIVDSYNEYSLEFDPTEGPVNEYNTVDVTVLEDDGDEARVNGIVNAILVDSSNEDAKVSVDVNKSNQLVIYSDQETVLDIVVTVNKGKEIIAAGTLEYTVGKDAPLANRTVVMTIDSTDYVVNNNIIKGDAAPYIDDAWRTMVPIRALMEAFDAEVIWDEANPDVVTINYDADTQIVMNVGETSYTINGEEGEMDTVPVNNNGRVYVPVRFVAEGIGFNVLPLYNADGLTASVVFQK